MADLLKRIWRFLAELKRRQVYRVAATYAGAAFVLWQATSLLVRALDWPEWAQFTFSPFAPTGMHG